MLSSMTPKKTPASCVPVVHSHACILSISFQHVICICDPHQTQVRFRARQVCEHRLYGSARDTDTTLRERCRSHETFWRGDESAEALVNTSLLPLPAELNSHRPAKSTAADSPPERQYSPSASDSASAAGTLSIAGDATSISGARPKRKTASERQREIAASAHCGELEPARAFCTTCDAWIELSAKTPYSTRPWTQHVRDAHEEGPAPRSRRRKEDADDDEADDVSTAAPSVTHTASDVTSSKKTEAQKRALLQADPRIEEVRAHEVSCRRCGQWVKLHAKQKYEIARWRAHCDGCTGTQYVPS
jgi:hypothetical protein